MPASSSSARGSGRAGATSTPPSASTISTARNGCAIAPISERGFTNLCTGAAATGTRPIVDFMFIDFLADAFGDMFNQMCKLQWMSQRPAEAAHRRARLRRRRAVERRPPFGQLLPVLHAHPRLPGGDALHPRRCQGAAEDRPALRRPGALPGAQESVDPQRAGAGRGIPDPVRAGGGAPRGHGSDAGRHRFHGAAGAGCGRAIGRRRGIRRSDRPAHPGAAGHRHDPGLGAQDRPAAGGGRRLCPVRRRRRRSRRRSWSGRSTTWTHRCAASTGSLPPRRTARRSTSRWCRASRASSRLLASCWRSEGRRTTMPFEVVLPRLGWNMETGRLGEWLKKGGERVEAGELLFTVEGDKATQEVEALDSGILHIPPDSPPPGQEVPVGHAAGVPAGAGRERRNWQLETRSWNRATGSDYPGTSSNQLPATSFQRPAAHHQPARPPRRRRTGRGLDRADGQRPQRPHRRARCAAGCGRCRDPPAV